MHFEESIAVLRAVVSNATGKLQHIRHIEMDFGDGEDFLFKPDSVWESSCIEDDEDDWTSIQSNLSECVKACRLLCDTNKCLLTLRRALKNLRSVSLCASGELSVGARVISSLARPESRSILCEAFPNLREIKCVNDYGGERFFKLGTGVWAFGYTREAIEQDGMRSRRGIQMYDPLTGLTKRSPRSSWILV